jgi:polyisoprenyl-phosphate glycosyltransferase
MFQALEAFGSDRPEISVVVPVYRSEDCLERLVAAIEAALEPTGRDYEVVLVNDGSPDRSWLVIESLCQARPNVVGLDLRRNFGQDNAILAGLRIARGNYVAIMDDDLQHDPADLPALIAKIEEGHDVVYASYRPRYQKSWKNLGSWFNGKVAEWLINKPKGIYLSPYKLVRGDVADLICRYDGPYPYVDGLLFQMTSRIAQIPVAHHPRFAGKSTYTFLKSVMVWMRLVTSFSVQPLRIVTWCGFGLASVGALLALYVIVQRLLFPEEFALAVAGWASLMVSLLFIGGVQMVFLGILGEYAGRTHTTLARKPQATIREVLNSGSSTDTDSRAVPDPAMVGGDRWVRA